MSFRHWISDKSIPSYKDPSKQKWLVENHWAAGQLSLFCKQLEDLNFKNHEISYIKNRGKPEDSDIVKNLLSL